jgi:hypothetical protein
MTVNRYATLAQEHWRTYRPNQYEQIPQDERESFFTQLGQEAERQIDELAEALAGQAPPDEDFLQRMSRLKMARLEAESQVLRERVLLPARDQEQDQPEPGGQPAMEFPRVEDPSHPFWRQVAEDEAARSVED